MRFEKAVEPVDDACRPDAGSPQVAVVTGLPQEGDVARAELHTVEVDGPSRATATTGRRYVTVEATVAPSRATIAYLTTARAGANGRANSRHSGITTAVPSRTAIEAWRR